MSRYTDYDALMDRLGICVKTGMGSTIAFTFKHIVDETPSIDIVHCGECKYWENYECQCEWASTDHEGGASYSLDRDADDFCSYGERRER